MRGLLSGSAPLRGRAIYEVMVRPFGYREAAAFWGVDYDSRLAFQTHALFGGTPAYRVMANSAPRAFGEFDDWVANVALNDSYALFREGAVILHEDPALTDISLYYAVLGAISRGAHRRGEIAAVLGRSDQSLSHPLRVLERTQLVEKVDDAFRQKRSVYRIAEPMIRLHQLLIAPNEPELVGGARSEVWQHNADTVTSKIYGPHFEELARQWTMWHASRPMLGTAPSSVQSATLACPAHQRGHELDVVATRKRPFESDVVLAIGEAKSTTKPVGESDLARLDHLRDLVPPDRYSTPPKLLLFSRNGFTKELQATAGRRPDTELIDLDRLYRGN